jgi:biotin synthase
MAGANSIFYGDKLLTTGNPDVEADQALFREAGLKPIAARSEPSAHVHGAACGHSHSASADAETHVGAAE